MQKKTGEDVCFLNVQFLPLRALSLEPCLSAAMDVLEALVLERLFQMPSYRAPARVKVFIVHCQVCDTIHTVLGVTKETIHKKAPRDLSE